MADALDDDFALDTGNMPSSPAAEASNLSPANSDAESAPPSKKRKLDKSEKDDKPKARSLALVHGHVMMIWQKAKRSKKQAVQESKPTIGFAPPEAQTDHLDAALSTSLTKASSLEKDELRFSGTLSHVARESGSRCDRGLVLGCLYVR